MNKFEEPSYKVRFPGQRTTSSDRYAFRGDKDPRILTIQRAKDDFYKTHGLKDDGLTEEEESEDDCDDENILCKTTIVHCDILRPTKKENDAWKAAAAKIQKNPLRSFKNRHKRAVKNAAQNLMERDCRCANEAIKFYNKKHGTDYEIVETLGTYSTLYIGFWFHCNFKAKCKSDTSRHSLPKMFFAELYRKKVNELLVHDCKMLKDPEQSPDIIRGCRMCGDQLWHPVNGFKAGAVSK